MTTNNELHRKRSELKAQGRFADAIPIQRQILASAQQSGRVLDVSNAWNMLSHLHHMKGDMAEAEKAARQALAIYENYADRRMETIATYEMKLAIILAAQECFDEAVHFGQLAVEHFSIFHNPPDEFLRARTDDVALMKRYRDAHTDIKN